MDADHSRMTLDQALRWAEKNCHEEAVRRLRSRAVVAVLVAEIERIKREGAANYSAPRFFNQRSFDESWDL